MRFVPILLALALPLVAAEPFEIKTGDRVVLLGDTLLERENTYGYLETRMHEQFPDRTFTVRNLSWAGDTPRGWSRASFDPAEKGMDRLKEAIELTKPTVVFLGYGMAASLQEMTDRAQDPTLNPDPARYGREPMSAARFKKELGELMTMIEGTSRGTQPGGLKDISPGQRPGLPGSHGARPEGAPERPASTAPAGAGAAGDANPRVSPGANLQQPSGLPGGVRFVLLSPIRHEDLRAQRPGLPDPAPHNALLEQYSKAIEELAKERGARFVPLIAVNFEWYRISGFDELWAFSPDGSTRPQAASARVFMTENGIHLTELGWLNHWESIESSFLGWNRNPKSKIQNPKSAALRAAVLRKNAVFFHRFRPANLTYLTGFRKHEQGQNAKEIAEFDALVAAADAEIDRLKRLPTSAGAKSGEISPETPSLSVGEVYKNPRKSIIQSTTPSRNVPASSVQATTPSPDVPASLVQSTTPSRDVPASLVQPTTPSPEVPARSVQGTTASPEAPAPSGAPTGASGNPPARVGTPEPVTPLPLPDFTVLEGYQIELWAENPHLEKPTQMNWDAQGRLWVASSSTYPQVDPQDVAITLARAAAAVSGKRTTENTERTEEKKGVSHPPPNSVPSVVQKTPSAGNDKVLILEDTDRDGRADKSTVFAEGLLIPTGVVPDLVPAGKTTENTENAEQKKGAPDSSASVSSVPSVVPSACYVAASTELLHLADTDGDGRADQRRVVFSGFGTEDTHHLIHTLRWGPDGRLYFNQSVYIHSHLETPWGMVRLNAGGVFAYDPRTERVEVFAKGLWNPWGTAWDDWGQMFLTDGAGRDGLSWAFPGAVFAPSEGARKTTVSVSPGSYPKFAGLEIVKSPHFPADWQGHAITCDFRAHRIVRFAIDDLSITAKNAENAEDTEKRKGAPISPSSAFSASSASSAVKSGYVTRELPDLLRTSDASFRPIDVRLGPDGALYLADWSNPVINHGEVDFRDPRRDKERGRIWRITKKDTPLVKWEPLAGKNEEELFDRIQSTSAWEQEQARQIIESEYEGTLSLFSSKAQESWGQRLLEGKIAKAEADSTVLRQMALLISRNSSIGWANSILTSRPDSRDRSLAARLLARYGATYFKIHANYPPEERQRWILQHHEELSGYVADANPRVRLEAMRALARIPTARSAELVLAAARNAPKDDPHYEFAAWQSINDLAGPWTEAIASGAWKADTAEREAQLAWGLKAIDPALAGATLAKLVAEKKVPLDGTGPWFELIGQAGGPAELQPLWDSLLVSFAGNCCETDETRELEGKVAFFDKTDTGARALTAVLEAARTRSVRPAARTHLASVLFHVEALRGGAIELAGLWQSPDLAEKLPEILADPQFPAALRRTAMRALRQHGAPAARELLESYAVHGTTPPERREAVLALATLDLPKAAPLLPDVLAALPDEAAALPVWRELLAIKGAPDELAKLFATEGWKNVAKPLRAAREAGKPAAKLLAALGPVASTAPRDYKALAASAKTDGDPAKGEMIYRRANLACVTCHAIGGAGGKVGPDMTSIGASAPLDYIIESVLAPAVKVKEGYNAVSVTMLDGLVVSGVQVRETAAEFVVRDAIGKEQSIPKGQIKAKTDIGSIMPAGLVEQLPPREQLDLYAFLGELGKPGPYDASKGSVARLWRLYPGDAAGVTDPGYSADANPGFPGYTLVDGRFVKDSLAESAQFAAAGKDAVLAVTQFQSAGKTRLKLTGASKAWLDGQPLTLTAVEAAPDLASGTHTLAVQLDAKALPEHLRAESPDARFLGN